MRKALDISGNELSREEYLMHLEAITPKVDDATKELKSKSKAHLKTVLREGQGNTRQDPNSSISEKRREKEVRVIW